MNKCLLTGTILGPPEVRYTTDGEVFCILTIATETRKGSCEVDVVCRGKKAEFAGKYLAAGRPIAIYAIAQTHTRSASGKSFRSTEIIAEDFEFVDSVNR